MLLLSFQLLIDVLFVFVVKQYKQSNPNVLEKLKKKKNHICLLKL